MRRALEMTVVAVASLGLLGLSVATCCVPEEGPCEHASDAHPGVEVAGHCAGTPAPSIQGACCAGPVAPEKDVGLAHAAPHAGAHAATSASPRLATAEHVSSPHRITTGSSPVRHSPILRL